MQVSSEPGSNFCFKAQKCQVSSVVIGIGMHVYCSLVVTKCMGGAACGRCLIDSHRPRAARSAHAGTCCYPTHHFFTTIPGAQPFTGPSNLFYSIERSFHNLQNMIIKRNPRCTNNLGDVNG